jgi:hypothetical protein
MTARGSEKKRATEKKLMLHHDKIPSHSSLLIRDFRKSQDHLRSTSSALASYRTNRLLFVPKAQINIERSTFGPFSV